MECSAGAVIFYKTKKGTVEYLLLHYPKLTSQKEKRRKLSGHWDFPKGHVEEGESEVETVRREVQEETGISPIGVLPDFRETIRYFFVKEGKRVFKEVVFYLAQAKTKNVQISFEHLGFEWLPFEKALQKITYKNAKQILKKANEFLIKREF